jgi:hypothetical protein
MREYHDMATYDQWPYMTMLGGLFLALSEEIQIDRRLLAVEPQDLCSPVFAAHFPIDPLE